MLLWCVHDTFPPIIDRGLQLQCDNVFYCKQSACGGLVDDVIVNNLGLCSHILLNRISGCNDG